METCSRFASQVSQIVRLLCVRNGGYEALCPFWGRDRGEMERFSYGAEKSSQDDRSDGNLSYIGTIAGRDFRMRIRTQVLFTCCRS
jgi:hypothetical protein